MLASLTGSVLGSPFEGMQWPSRDLPLISKPSLSAKLTTIRGSARPAVKAPALTGDVVATLSLFKAIEFNQDPKSSLIELCSKYKEKGVLYGSAFSAWLEGSGKMDLSLEGSGCLTRISFLPAMSLKLEEQLAIAVNLTELTHNNKTSLKAVSDLLMLVHQVKSTKSDVPLKAYLGKHKFIKDCLDLHNNAAFTINAAQILLHACRVVVQSRSMEDVYRYSFYVGGNSCALASVAAILAGPLYAVPPQLLKVTNTVINKHPDLSAILSEFATRYPRVTSC